MKRLLFSLGWLLVAVAAPAQKFDTLAQTPPMGWNSWNHFGCQINEEIVRATADAMVRTGMKAAGYEYVVVDDCWQVRRDSTGQLVADPARFPSGMDSLGAYLHSKGLKFGIYSDAGRKTCQERPGSWGHEYQDARTFARWGVDYLKYDWCHHGLKRAQNVYPIMRDALHAAGRPIVYSICNWGWGQPWQWADTVGHLWRTTLDIKDCWRGTPWLVHRCWTNILDKNARLHEHAGPGHWNDPDMLEVGNGGMSTTEYRAHFSLWCMMAAPLMAGNDLRNMDSTTAAILTNRAAIAIDQDPLGRQGWRLRDRGAHEVWVKPLRGGDWAVCFFNRATEAAALRFDWNDLPGWGGPYQLYDCWAHEQQGTARRTGTWRGRVPGHGVRLFRLRRLSGDL